MLLLDLNDSHLSFFCVCVCVCVCHQLALEENHQVLSYVVHYLSKLRFNPGIATGDYSRLTRLWPKAHHWYSPGVC